ncbi:MAG: hypothetical protein WBY44_34095, partial [Bryobacteraceae bacterium]
MFTLFTLLVLLLIGGIFFAGAVLIPIFVALLPILIPVLLLVGLFCGAQAIFRSVANCFTQPSFE